MLDDSVISFIHFFFELDVGCVLGSQFISEGLGLIVHVLFELLVLGKELVDAGLVVFESAVED